MNLTKVLSEYISEYAPGITQQEIEFAVKYLLKYGYFDDFASPHFDLESRIRKFQWLFDISTDGIIGKQTLKAMKVKRCGCKDIDYERAVRPWNKPIRYYLEDSPIIDGKRDSEKFDYVMQEAFKRWRDVCDFPESIRVSSKSQANFYIDTRTGRRNDFDGPSGTLAYATLGMTNQSICFFDGDENFTVEKSGGIKILHVATHEIGHSLFLGHSKVGGALMAPTYSSKIGYPQQNDDIPRAQSGYGPPVTKPKPEPKPEPTPEPVDPQPTPAGYTQIFLKGEIEDIKIDGFRVHKMS